MSQKNGVKLTPPDVIVFGEDGYEMDAIRKAGEFVAEGLVAENAVFDNVEDVMAYAEEKNISKVVIVSDKIKTIDMGGQN